MTIAKPMITKFATVEVVVGTGAQTPSPSITDGILATIETNIVPDQLELNGQDDVVSPSLGKRKTIIGSKGGSFTIAGNLASFGNKASKKPAIDPALTMAGMVYTATDKMTFAGTPTNIAVNTIVENVGQTATGTVIEIDGLDVYVTASVGTFADGEDIQTAVGTLVVGTLEAVDGYTALQGASYRPISTGMQVASVYHYIDGQRMALSDCATNLEVSIDANALGKFTLAGMGKYDETNWAPAALPTVSYLDSDPAPFMDSAMKLTFGGTSFVPVNTQISWNLGNQVILRKNSVDSAGLVGAYIASRSDATAGLSMENETQNDFDYITTMLDSESGTFEWRLGDGTEGETIFLYQNVSITSSANSDDGGLNTVALELDVIDPQLDNGDCIIHFR